MKQTITINSIQSLARALTMIDEEWHKEKYLEIKIVRKANQRTDQQRKSIEVFCRELATTLNGAGLDQRVVFASMREGVEIPWQQASVKDSLWRPIQIASTGKKSTRDLLVDEVSKVYDILNRWISEKFGVSVQFPEKER